MLCFANDTLLPPHKSTGTVNFLLLGNLAVSHRWGHLNRVTCGHLPLPGPILASAHDRGVDGPPSEDFSAAVHSDKALMSSARYAKSICTPGASLLIARASVLSALERPNKNNAQLKMFTCVFFCGVIWARPGDPAVCMYLFVNCVAYDNRVS